MVELLPSKQNVASSSLVSRSSAHHPSIRAVVDPEAVFCAVFSGVRGAKGAYTGVDRPCGSVVEHSLGKGEVARSIRAMGTSERRDAAARRD